MPFEPPRLSNTPEQTRRRLHRPLRRRLCARCVFASLSALRSSCAQGTPQSPIAPPPLEMAAADVETTRDGTIGTHGRVALRALVSEASLGMPPRQDAEAGDPRDAESPDK